MQDRLQLLHYLLSPIIHFLHIQEGIRKKPDA